MWPQYTAKCGSGQIVVTGFFFPFKASFSGISFALQPCHCILCCILRFNSHFILTVINGYRTCKAFISSDL